MSKPISKPHDPGLSVASAIYNQLSSSPAKAWKQVRSALKTHPKSERVQFVAGLVLIARDKKIEARKHFAEAIKLGTAGPDAYLNLAQLSAEIGQTEFALNTLDRAEARFEGDLQVMMARVQVLQIAGDTPRALVAVNAVLAHHSSADEARLLQGILLADNGKLLEAITSLENLLRDKPHHILALLNLGRFYAFTNRPVQGLEVTERAYALAPDMAVVIENLAIRRRENGDFKGAVSLFRQLIALSPQFAPEAYRQLADIVGVEELETLVERIDQTGRTVNSVEARAQLEFAHAGVAKRQRNDKNYVNALKRANRLLAKRRPYDPKVDTQFHKYILDSYRAQEVFPDFDSTLPATPVFIVGLPRSGTTLLERMLSAGPQIAGLGEVSLFNRYFGTKMASGAAVAEGLPGLRENYAAFQKTAGDAGWTVDKMPANYMHIGWIKRVLPEAKIILLQRDHRDLALSLFENYFDDPNQNFSFDEAGIVHRLDMFNETVASWTELGKAFLEISYEELVHDPEVCLRRIAEYCGFPFDKAMLKPEDNQSSIRTASSLQARHGINQNSIARWRKYPDLLPKIFKE